MIRPNSCAAVVPCLNEARSISRLVHRIHEYLPTVFVVDDGSSDDTAQLSSAAGAVLLAHPATRGKGHALETGFARAFADGYTWAFCLDGDGQHNPDNIPSFLQTAELESASLVIGNRMASCRSMPLLRKLVNHWMSRRLSNLCHVPVPDSQCGFRLLNLQVWSRLSLCASQFEIESEMLVRFAAAHQKVSFVPVDTIYGCEQSKIHPIRDSIRWIKWFLRVRSELHPFRITPPPILHDLAN